MTRNSPSLDHEMPEGHVEMNPADVSALGIKEYDDAKIISRRGEVVTKVQVTDWIKPGTIFVSFHFMEANANVLTNPALDPICKIRNTKSAPCAWKKSRSPRPKPLRAIRRQNYGELFCVKKDCPDPSQKTLNLYSFRQRYRFLFGSDAHCRLSC